MTEEIKNVVKLSEEGFEYDKVKTERIRVNTVSLLEQRQALLDEIAKIDNLLLEIDKVK